MPGFLLGLTTNMKCFHGAKAMIVPGQVRVLVAGQPVATSVNVIGVVGCPFQVGTKPQPCMTVKWALPSTRFVVGGQPALLDPTPGPAPGPGICQSAEQVPQGAPILTPSQVRVTGS